MGRSSVADLHRVGVDFGESLQESAHLRIGCRRTVPQRQLL